MHFILQVVQLNCSMEKWTSVKWLNTAAHQAADVFNVKPVCVLLKRIYGAPQGINRRGVEVGQNLCHFTSELLSAWLSFLLFSQDNRKSPPASKTLLDSFPTKPREPKSANNSLKILNNPYISSTIFSIFRKDVWPYGAVKLSQWRTCWPAAVLLCPLFTVPGCDSLLCSVILQGHQHLPLGPCSVKPLGSCFQYKAQIF